MHITVLGCTGLAVVGVLNHQTTESLSGQGQQAPRKSPQQGANPHHEHQGQQEEFGAEVGVQDLQNDVIKDRLLAGLPKFLSFVFVMHDPPSFLQDG